VVEGDALGVGVGRGAGVAVAVGLVDDTVGEDTVEGVGGGVSRAVVQPRRETGSAAARRTARLIWRPYAWPAADRGWKDRVP
jgi:hypothetical protein